MPMDEKNKTPKTPETEQSPIPERDPVTGKRARRDPKDLNAFENFYENFRNVPIKYVDRFIALCVIALVVVVAIGIINR